MISELFDPAEWELAPGAASFTDITAHISNDGRIARIGAADQFKRKAAGQLLAHFQLR